MPSCEPIRAAPSVRTARVPRVGPSVRAGRRRIQLQARLCETARATPLVSVVSRCARSASAIRKQTSSGGTTRCSDWWPYSCRVLSFLDCGSRRHQRFRFRDQERDLRLTLSSDIHRQRRMYARIHGALNGPAPSVCHAVSVRPQLQSRGSLFAGHGRSPYRLGSPRSMCSPS